MISLHRMNGFWMRYLTTMPERGLRASVCIRLSEQDCDWDLVLAIVLLDALLTNEYDYSRGGLCVLLAVPLVREHGLMVTTPRQSIDGD